LAETQRVAARAIFWREQIGQFFHCVKANNSVSMTETETAAIDEGEFFSTNTNRLV
jgi:hypothetical protein